MLLRALILVALSLALLGCATTTRFSRGGVDVHTFTIDATNVHLVSKGDAAILVDSGYEKNAQALDERIRKAGFDPRNIKAIVLTHGHADHAGGARYFQQAYGTPVLAGVGDQKMLAAGANEPLCPTGFLGLVRQTEDQAATFGSTAADRWVEAPTDLKEIAGIDGTVAPLPGHTDGSLVVVVGESVFAGDLLRGSLVGSSAATHLFMCDLARNQRNVDTVLHKLAPRGQTFFVGHFGPVSRASVASHFDVKD
jgi:hydroxyacylglutathione hydrolase